MVAAALVAAVVAVCISALIAWRWWLDARGLGLASAREHETRIATLKAQEVSEGMRMLPSHVAEIERRVKQLELRSR